ncbi:MAG: rubrerythrin family protein [Nitrospirota bacterium]|jgi:rubrerythrin
MKKMTEENLKAAFAGESQAHMKYLVFADKAEQEGKLNTARLFKAIAYAEQVHATNHLKALGNVKSTSENLDTAIGGETFEVEEMYPAYNAVAELQNEKGAKKSMGWAEEAEKIHITLYGNAKKAMLKGEDVKVGDIYICEFCGYTAEGKAPDKCPLCGAAKDKFKKF